MSLPDILFKGSPLENVGIETILHFIQNTVSKNNDFNVILDNVSKKHKEELTFSVPEEVDGESKSRNITASAKGFYYERLWDICIKFGVTDLTLGTTDKTHQTTHIFDNSNKETIDVTDNCWNGNVLNDFLHQNVRSGNSGGYSDITFVNKAPKTDEEVYFLSVKYFKTEKDIGEYDIGKLCTLIRQHEKEHRTIKLYICVNNKKDAIEKFNKQHRSSAILLKYINPGGNYEHVYDSEDLRRFYFNLKKVLEQYNYLKTSGDIERFNTEYLKTLKAAFIPRFHQKLFISKINKLIDDRERHILVGAIPRSGKSYIMAGTILEYVKKHARGGGKKLNFLLMTPAPNETFPEYKSIFNNYIDFDKNQIETKLYNEQGLTPAVDKHTVHIISKQRLGYIESDDAEEMDDEKYIQKIRENLKKIFKDIPHFDIIFLDEAHFGMSTTRAQNIVKELTRTFDEHENTTQIYVTATYRRPLKEYKVLANCKMTWDLTDIEIMKHIGEEPTYPIRGNKIEKQFSTDIYTDTLAYYGDETGDSIAPKLKKDYAKYPKPYLITPLWDKEFVKVEKTKLYNTDFGWSMDTLFTAEGGSFKNEDQVKEMMRYYFGYPDKSKNYEEQSFYRTRGIIPRIRNICMNNCRTQQQKHKTTQLWFLPVGSGRIQDKISALITLLTNVNDFKDIANTYHFYAAVEVDKPEDTKHVTYMKEPKNIKKEIESLERELRGDIEKKPKKDEKSGDNLIILAGQRLQLGISLRNVDIVTLWNSIKSADAIFQMLFRSMTEVDGPKCHGDEGYCDEKKFGFMVDMDPQRALTNVSLFSDITTKPKTVEEARHYKEITDLINIDEDVFHDRFGDDDAARKKFVKELFDKLYSSWNINVDKTKEIIGKFSFDTDKLDKLKSQLKSIYTDKSRKLPESAVGSSSDDEFGKPTRHGKEGDAKKKGKPKPKPEQEIDTKEKATEIISEYISLLNIFTLYNDDETKCILSDTFKEGATKVKVISDIHQLKDAVFKKDKDIFLQILNGRLTGSERDEASTNPIDKKFLDKILDTISDEGDKLTINKIIMSQKKQYYTINEPEKLLEFINGELKPKEQEKKENGEVFTPLDVVKDMMDNLDEAYKKQHGRSIFSESKLTWLDPAVGIGNFPIIVYQRLMEGLKQVEPDDERRRKHILEKMIYSSELTPKNVFIYRKIFCGDTYKLNINEGDSLQMDIKTVFESSSNPYSNPDFNGFDVILGNPPYNKGGIRSHTGKQLLEGEKSETIWTKFIEKSFEWLKPGGFLVFINPLSWLKKSHSLHNAMLDKHIVWLKLWDDSQSKGIINADIPISLYVLQNTQNSSNKKTEIHSEIKRKKLTTTSSEYLNPRYSIPLAYHSIFSKLIQYIEKNNCSLEYNTKTVKNEVETTKVLDPKTGQPVVDPKTGQPVEKTSSKKSVPIPSKYKLEDMWAVDTYTLNDGILVKKATEIHPDANKRKLIIANKRGFKGAFIDEGKLSLTGTDKIYILGENLELILKIMNFGISNILCDYTKYRMSFLEKEVCNYIPDIRKLGIEDITEDEFYKLIGLTQQEINQIKNQQSNEGDELERETEEQEIPEPSSDMTKPTMVEAKANAKAVKAVKTVKAAKATKAAKAAIVRPSLKLAKSAKAAKAATGTAKAKLSAKAKAGGRGIKLNRKTLKKRKRNTY